MTFTENWYPDNQHRMLRLLIPRILHLKGRIIEVGCWEGNSTRTIIRAAVPHVVHCVDTWEGSLDENPNHATVLAAKERDVYARFIANLSDTDGNFEPYRMDWRVYFHQTHGTPIRFLHIDGAHDYRSVKDNIDIGLDDLVVGGFLCGDDIQTANATRTDLGGGVERAVRESLPGYHTDANFWWWEKR